MICRERVANANAAVSARPHLVHPSPTQAHLLRQVILHELDLIQRLSAPAFELCLVGPERVELGAERDLAVLRRATLAGRARDLRLDLVLQSHGGLAGVGGDEGREGGWGDLPAWPGGRRSGRGGSPALGRTLLCQGDLKSHHPVITQSNSQRSPTQARSPSLHSLTSPSSARPDTGTGSPPPQRPVFNLLSQRDNVATHLSLGRLVDDRDCGIPSPTRVHRGRRRVLARSCAQENPSPISFKSNILPDVPSSAGACLSTPRSTDTDAGRARHDGGGKRAGGTDRRLPSWTEGALCRGRRLW